MGYLGDDIEEVPKAVQCAWKVCRQMAPSKKKVGAKRVDLKEFHGFIAAFRWYLELAELFEHLDAHQEDDQKLSLRECWKGKDQLAKWGVREEQLQEHFQGMEPEEPKWKFENFAKFCVEQRWEQEMTVDLELDTDDEGVQSESALAD